MFGSGSTPFKRFTVDSFHTDGKLEAERLTLMRKYMRTEQDSIVHPETRATLKLFDQNLAVLLNGAENPRDTLARLIGENSMQVWGSGHSKPELQQLGPACDALRMAFLRCAIKDWRGLIDAYESSTRIWDKERPSLEAAVAALEPMLSGCNGKGHIGDRLGKVAKALKVPIESGVYPEGVSKEKVLSLAGPLVELLAGDAGIPKTVKRQFAVVPSSAESSLAAVA